jgi:GNAT superfamily N-acetyltransferase
MNSSGINIVEVKSRKQIRNFIDFPNRLYKNDPHYVSELYISVKMMFDRKNYPFFAHSRADFFLAYKDLQPAGRIVAIRNNKHISLTGERCGFFGFFECVDDYEVAKTMIDRAVEWCRAEQLTCIAGPENYTTNDSVGFLMKGFDTPPVFMMPYNKPYYIDFFERYGFRKRLDLSSYFISSNSTPDRIVPIVRRIEERLKINDILIRPVNLHKFDREMAKFRVTYNESYKHNWGFIPLAEDEFYHQSEGLRKIADPELILLAEKDGRLIAFVVAIPDINQVLIRIKNGRLFPTGLFKLLIYRKKITNLRILILGVLDEYRGQGIDAVLYSKLFEYARAKQIMTAEAAYVMENNTRMVRILQDLGGIERKIYRLYEYDIPEESNKE